MPIYVADTMVPLIIKRITGNDKIRNHLANLGFVPGVSVILVSKINDNIIVKIKGISMAVSNELAKRIQV